MRQVRDADTEADSEADVSTDAGGDVVGERGVGQGLARLKNTGR